MTPTITTSCKTKTKMARLSCNKIALLLTTTTIVFWLQSDTIQELLYIKTIKIDTNNSHVVKFTNQVQLRYDYVRKHCFKGTKPRTVRDLRPYLYMLERSRLPTCRQQHALFTSIYKVRVKSADIFFSDLYRQKVTSKLGVTENMLDSMKHQTIIFVDNTYSLESIVYNVARINFPNAPSGNLTEYIRYSVDSTRKGCDFCSVTTTTATDTFGLMESKHTVIVSNAFKIEKYHGLAIPRRHHATNWTQYEFIDAMHLILKWFRKVHSISPTDIYRIIYWDLLLKAGVSQMHPHFHLTVGNDKYYSKWNELFEGGLKFAREYHNMNYWTALLQIHTTLGLAMRYKRASVMCYLTPKRDYEVVVISDSPNLDFFRLVYFVLRSFIEDLREPSVSMGWVFPKLYYDQRHGDELPMIFRIVSRGDPISLVSDFNAFDLYGTPNINKDPYTAMRMIKRTVKRKSREKFEFPDWIHSAER